MGSMLWQTDPSAGSGWTWSSWRGASTRLLAVVLLLACVGTAGSSVLPITHFTNRRFSATKSSGDDYNSVETSPFLPCMLALR